DATELPEAEHWVEGADAVDLGSSTDLRDLIAASRRTLMEREEAREEARQREIAHARALAEAQRRRADEAARAARRQRQLLLGVALLALGAVAGVVLAAQQRAVAVRQRNALQKDLLETYVEKGRQLLLAGQPLRALLWLQRAFEGGMESPSLRFLL